MAFRIVSLLVCVCFLSACTSVVDGFFKTAIPNHTQGAPTQPTKNIVSQEIDAVTVSAWLLPDEEARERYGVDLAGENLQVIWLSIENNSPDELWLLKRYTDPDYFTADEAFFLFHGRATDEKLVSKLQHFRNLDIPIRIEPNRTYEGHVVVPRSQGGRYVEVTVNGKTHVRRFGFPLRTPDGHFDFEGVNPEEIYTDRTLPDLSEDQFRAQLTELPCCTADSSGNIGGDPLNFVLIGDVELVMAALSQSRWSFTHKVDFLTVVREIGSAFEGKEYLNAPVSNLYLFNRPQDLAFQRGRHSISQRNHMRLWLAPYKVTGQSVWIGQVSRDIGVKITTLSPTLTTHVIDPVVDEARQYVFESFLFKKRVDRFGFVHASAPSSLNAPRQNLVGDPYITDGMRLVLFLANQDVQLEAVRNLNWDQTKKDPIEAIQERE